MPDGDFMANSRTTRLFAWDKGLNFEEWNRKFLELIECYKRLVFVRRDARAVRPLAYLLVLFVQLRNALRKGYW